MHGCDALPHPDWHRLAGLRPRWREGVHIQRQWLRGERWHVLQDGPGQQHCRLSAAAYDALGRLDGRLTLGQLWQALDAAPPHGHAAPPCDPPSQAELISLVRQLHSQQMLAFDEAPDFGTLDAHATWPQPPAPHTRPGGQSLLAWRMPLLDPSAWLARQQRLAELVFSPAGALLWLGLMATLAWGMLTQHGALLAHARVWMPTPAYLLMAALSYPVIKLLHEAAHALCTQRWGGRVHEAGIVWMLGLPLPYVDASASHGFAHAWQRALVSAAGIQCELALAALGLLVWQHSEPGWWHDMGFIWWFVGGISTLLFNANPLQRLDGYHLLCDLLHLPNWAPRSQQWWAARRRAWLTGLSMAEAGCPHTAPGEGPWLIAHAPLAWACQALIWLAMTWWLGSISAWLGWAMAAYGAWHSLWRPLWALAQQSWHGLLWAPQGHAPHAGHRRRAQKVALLAWPCLLLAMLLPWPASTVVPGVVWAPEDALVRPDADGLVQSVHQADGAHVRSGDLIVRLHNPRLHAERQGVAAQLAQAEYSQFSLQDQDRAGAGQAADQVATLQARLARLDEQIAALQVRAHRAGRLVLPQAADLSGQYLRRGAVLGQVLSGQAALVRVAVAEHNVASLREGVRQVSVHGTSPDGRPQPARLLRDAIGATRELPSPALSQAQGGEVLTDPQDPHHLRTVRPVVLMDVVVANVVTDMTRPALVDQHQGEAPPDRLGQRAWVRFEQGWQVPLWRGLQWLRQRVHQDFRPAP